MNLKQFIRDIPDFPKPGILFRDVTPLLSNPQAFNCVMEEFSKLLRAVPCDAIVGIESRGFIFGAALAQREKLPFIPVRKPGKLPYEKKSVEYSLEYGAGQLEIHSDALKRGQRVVIVDDLLATGGTMRAAVQLVELLGGKCSAFFCVVELNELKGRALVGDGLVHSLIQY